MKKISPNSPSCVMIGLSNNTIKDREMEKKILLVDDESLFPKPDRTFFEREGFRIMTAGNFRDALDMAVRERPDIIILNIRSSGMNEVGCLRRIKRNAALKSIPVAMVAEKKSERKRYLDAGADNVLMKPVSHEELFKTVGVSLRIPFRKHPRAHVNILVKYENLDLFLTDYASNLGCGGMFIETDRLLPQGTKTDLEFHIPEISVPVKTKGMVVWTGKGRSGKKGMGIQFEGLDQATRKVINDYVEKSIGMRS